MKRLGLTLVAAVCLSASVFAAGNQPTTEKWDGNINVTKLSNYLKLTSDQHEKVSNICNYFNQQMTRATHSKKNQDSLLRNAIYANLKLMKQTLDKKQYADYAKVLNATLRNRNRSEVKHFISIKMIANY